MSGHHSDSDAEEDDIFAQLEAEIERDDTDAAFREEGIQALRREMEQVKAMKEGGHGRYDEIMNEKEVIRTSANEAQCVIHFYHHNFKRCQIMDQHLAALAPKYFGTRFLRVFVENVPWLVEKLQIKVLPCVITFVDGVTRDKLIGFEELGNEDSFKTAVLELRLSQSGVLQKASEASSSNPTYTARGGSFTVADKRSHKLRSSAKDDDSDLDLDD
ncbi:thioredoxin-like protein [Punctularia strigosozonata HHB-11173 SS5]|uniref:thioredoxin-like protein n=1 Tax=Punctularia strigosozonata (strain HHB-11173) TaxID=741275 RepID=UPI0004417BB0|nr:thioredoxin-like protein [Punctularia strigosozonata HHB-11173 SS5]EIN10415.1 thioredoxin-like protein [Punctularia strigosozonata HHB-11173 SS5]